MISAKSKNRKKNTFGVYGDGGITYLFYKQDQSSNLLSVEASSDGQNFSKFKENIKIIDSRERKVSLKSLSYLSVSRIYDNYFLYYQVKSRGKTKSYCAEGKNFDSFSKLAEIPGVLEDAVLVANYKTEGKYVLVFGGASIKAAFSSDLKSWSISDEPIVKTYQDFFGENPLKIGNAFVTDEGILLVYFAVKAKKNLNHFEIKAEVLDKENPLKILRHVGNVIWESPEEWLERHILPLGIVNAGDKLLSFWKLNGEIYSVPHPYLLFEGEKKYFPHVILHKLKNNPIIRPIVENLWESKATFNPAAMFEKGKVHIIYRAVGDDDVSVLGYAASFDGINIDERLNQPVYTPTEPFESSGPYKGQMPVAAGRYASGGGCFGGCEDPRITRIDDRVYMTYVAYDGYNPPRIAFTSINFGDFMNHKWQWEKPVIISKPGVVDKNACILPEKINGKYVIFHRIFPDILIDFVDNLNFDGNTFLKGEYAIKPRENYWDSRKVGVGPPPIKTDEGWILIYQAVGENDPSRYKMGVMLLDNRDPTNVLVRSTEPILSPDEWYENDGFKAGVAYPCGTVAIDNKLIVYYGGADTVVCAATARMDRFVSNLKHHKSLIFSPNRVSSSNS